MSEVGGWVRLDEIPGGIVVYCRLCGRKDFQRTFMAVATNYSEARRAATAYHWEHEHSDEHKAATAVYHANEVPEVTAEERLLAQIFKKPLPDERSRRRQAAKSAARRERRKKL